MRVFANIADRIKSRRSSHVRATAPVSVRIGIWVIMAIVVTGGLAGFSHVGERNAAAQKAATAQVQAQIAAEDAASAASTGTSVVPSTPSTPVAVPTSTATGPQADGPSCNIHAGPGEAGCDGLPVMRNSDSYNAWAANYERNPQEILPAFRWKDSLDLYSEGGLDSQIDRSLGSLGGIGFAIGALAWQFVFSATSWALGSEVLRGATDPINRGFGHISKIVLGLIGVVWLATLIKIGKKTLKGDSAAAIRIGVAFIIPMAMLIYMASNAQSALNKADSQNRSTQEQHQSLTDKNKAESAGGKKNCPVTNTDSTACPLFGTPPWFADQGSTLINSLVGVSAAQGPSALFDLALNEKDQVGSDVGSAIGAGPGVGSQIGGGPAKGNFDGARGDYPDCAGYIGELNKTYSVKSGAGRPDTLATLTLSRMWTVTLLSLWSQTQFGDSPMSGRVICHLLDSNANVPVEEQQYFQKAAFPGIGNPARSIFATGASGKDARRLVFNWAACTYDQSKNKWDSAISLSYAGSSNVAWQSSNFSWVQGKNYCGTWYNQGYVGGTGLNAGESGASFDDQLAQIRNGKVDDQFNQNLPECAKPLPVSAGGSPVPDGVNTNTTIPSAGIAVRPPCAGHEATQVSETRKGQEFVDAFFGRTSGSQRLISGFLVGITGIIYGAVLAGLALGTVLATFGLVILLMFLPITLLLLALGHASGKRMLKTTVGFMASKLLYTFLLVAMIEVIGLGYELMNGLGATASVGSGAMQAQGIGKVLIAALIPLLCLFAFHKILKAAGLSGVLSPRGALGLHGEMMQKAGMGGGLSNFGRNVGDKLSKHSTDKMASGYKKGKQGIKDHVKGMRQTKRDEARLAGMKHANGLAHATGKDQPHSAKAVHALEDRISGDKLSRQQLRRRAAAVATLGISSRYLDRDKGREVELISAHKEALEAKAKITEAQAKAAEAVQGQLFAHSPDGRTTAMEGMYQDAHHMTAVGPSGEAPAATHAGVVAGQLAALADASGVVSDGGALAPGMAAAVKMRGAALLGLSESQVMVDVFGNFIPDPSQFTNALDIPMELRGHPVFALDSGQLDMKPGETGAARATRITGLLAASGWMHLDDTGEHAVVEDYLLDHGVDVRTSDGEAAWQQWSEGQSTPGARQISQISLPSSGMGAELVGGANELAAMMVAGNVREAREMGAFVRESYQQAIAETRSMLSDAQNQGSNIDGLIVAAAPAVAHANGDMTVTVGAVEQGSLAIERLSAVMSNVVSAMENNIGGAGATIYMDSLKAKNPNITEDELVSKTTQHTDDKQDELIEALKGFTDTAGNVNPNMLEECAGWLNGAIASLSKEHESDVETITEAIRNEMAPLLRDVAAQARYSDIGKPQRPVDAEGHALAPGPSPRSTIPSFTDLMGR